MSGFHPTVTCKECRSTDIKGIAPVRLRFQPHVKCNTCGHEELELLTFMRWDGEREDAKANGKALCTFCGYWVAGPCESDTCTLVQP